MDGVGLGIFRILIELEGIRELANYIDGLDQAAKNILPIVGAIVCAYGILQCFLGYKLFKFWCGVVGLFIGILIGEAVVTSGVLTNTPGAYLIGLLIILFFAIIGAFVAYRAYLVGLFIYSFAAAFLIVFYLVEFFVGSPLAALITGIIAGIVMGVVAVIFKKFWIIISTSVYGGISICTGMMMIMLTAELGWLFIVPPVFAIAGFLVQYFTVNKAKKVNASVPQPVYVTNAPSAYPEMPSQTPPPDMHPEAAQPHAPVPDHPAAAPPDTHPAPPATENTTPDVPS